MVSQNPIHDSKAVASQIATKLEQAISMRGRASFVVCGGSSPLDIYAALAEMPLDWASVTLTLADDRAVPKDHQDSNIRLIEQHLQTGYAAAAEFIPLQDLAAEKLVPFDVVMLGMGPDGHIASLFPDMLDNADALSLQAPPKILNMPAKGQPLLPRISMNLSYLTCCQDLLLVVKGPEKQALVQSVLQEPASAPYRYPVSVLLAQKKKAVTIYFIR